MTLTIDGKDYKVRFGYNSFCDNDVFDRVKDMLTIMSPQNTEEDANNLDRIRDLFKVTRDLLFIGFKKYNPVESLEEVGELLDKYHDEAPEGEDRGILHVFLSLSEELMNEGFLSDMIQTQTPTPNRAQRRATTKK